MLADVNDGRPLKAIRGHTADVTPGPISAASVRWYKDNGSKTNEERLLRTVFR